MYHALLDQSPWLYMYGNIQLSCTVCVFTLAEGNKGHSVQRMSSFDVAHYTAAIQVRYSERKKDKTKRKKKILLAPRAFRYCITLLQDHEFTIQTRLYTVIIRGVSSCVASGASSSY